MNSRSHQLIFSRKLGVLIAVGEHASSRGKAAGGSATHRSTPLHSFKVRMLCLACLMLSLGSRNVLAGVAANTLPQGALTQAGAVTIQTQDAQMTLVQGTPSASVNWTSFSIGSGASVRIVQPTSNAVLLNRVVGNDASQIFGKLSANGQVFLINPNGIVFGATGSVTASAFTASTFGLSDDDFLKGNLRFNRNGSNAAIKIEHGARIDTSSYPNGYVALIGSQISNSGTIATQGGQVVLAAGERVTLPRNLAVPLSARVSLEISPASISTHIANNADAVIQTQGGQVLIQASSLVDAIAGVQSSVTHAGVIDTSADLAGDVALLANQGEVQVQGVIQANSRGQDAPGANIVIGRDVQTDELAAITDVSQAVLQARNGDVETSAELLLTDQVSVRAKNWLLDPTDVLITQADAPQPPSNNNTSVIRDSTLNAQLDAGTNVTIQTNSSGGGLGDITVLGRLGQTSGNQSAKLTLDAYRHLVVNTDVGSNGGAGALALTAIAGGNISFNGFIHTSGGDVSLTAGSASRANLSNAALVLRNDVVLNSNGGNIAIAGHVSAANNSLTLQAGSGQVVLGANGKNVSGLSALSLTSTHALNAIASNITGSTTLSFHGMSQGALALTGRNTYSGWTRLTDGTLQVGNGNAALNAQLGSGAIYMSGNTSTLYFYTGNTVVLNQSLMGNGSVLSTEDLQFNGGIELLATSASNSFLNIKTQASTQSATSGNIYVGGGVTHRTPLRSSLNITANNGLFLNSAITAFDAATDVALTANGLSYGVAASDMNASQLSASRGLVISGQGDIASRGGKLSMVGYSYQTVQNAANEGTAVHLSSRSNVSTSGVLSGTNTSDLEISADSISIQGVSNSGWGVRINSGDKISSLMAHGDVTLAAKGTNGLVSDFSGGTSGYSNLIQTDGKITIQAESIAPTGIGISASGLLLKGRQGIALHAQLASSAQTAIEFLNSAGRAYGIQAVDANNLASGDVFMQSQGGRMNFQSSALGIVGQNITIDNTYSDSTTQASMATLGRYASTSTTGSALTLASNVTATGKLWIGARQSAPTGSTGAYQGLDLFAFLTASNLQVTAENNTSSGIGMRFGGVASGINILANNQAETPVQSFVQGIASFNGGKSGAALSIDSTTASLHVGSGAKLKLLGSATAVGPTSGNNNVGVRLSSNLVSSGDLTLQGDSNSFNGVLDFGTITHSGGNLTLLGTINSSGTSTTNGLGGAGVLIFKDININNGSLQVVGGNNIKNGSIFGNGVLIQGNLNVMGGDVSVTGYTSMQTPGRSITLQGNITSDRDIHLIGQSHSTSTADTMALLGNINTGAKVSLTTLGGWINVSSSVGDYKSINAGSLVMDNTGAGQTSLFNDENAGLVAGVSLGGGVASDGRITRGSGFSHAYGGITLQGTAINVKGNINMAAVTQAAGSRGVFVNTAIQSGPLSVVNIYGQNTSVGASNSGDGVSIENIGAINSAGGTVQSSGLSSVRGSSGIRLASSAAGVTAITADQINLNGTSSSQLGNGILLNATLATTNSSARNLTSTLQGVSASANSAYSGVEIDGNTRISAAAGTRISINAEASQTALISNGSSGVGISSNARLISSGHVSVKGLSYNASGLAVKTGATWTHNGADSTLLLAGSTTSNAAGVSLETNTSLTVASRLDIQGDNTNETQKSTGHGVILAGNITNNAGSTTIHADQSGIQILQSARIQHNVNAGAIDISAGNDDNTNAASIRLNEPNTALSSAPASSAHITQLSNAGIFVATLGAGDLSVAKISNQGTGNVVVGAGIHHTSSDSGGNIKTALGYTISNARGKTYLYSGNTDNTNALANLNSQQLGQLYLDTQATYTQNTAVNTVFDADNLGIGSAATVQVAFRGKANFSDTLNGYSASTTYGDAHTANTSEAQRALVDSFKDNLIANNAKQFSASTHAGLLNIAGNTLIRDLSIELQAPTYSSAGYLNAATYTASVKTNQYVIDLTSEPSVALRVAPQSVTALNIHAHDKTYDRTTQALVDFSQSALSGTLANDQAWLDLSQLKASFNTADVAYAQAQVTSKIVQIDGIRLLGRDANNYAMASSTTTTATITPKPLALDYVIQDKVFDNTTHAIALPLVQGVLAQDKVEVVHGSAEYDSSVAGFSKPVTITDIALTGKDQGNYQLPAPIQTTHTAYARGNLLPPPNDPSATHFSKETGYVASLSLPSQSAAQIKQFNFNYLSTKPAEPGFQLAGLDTADVCEPSDSEACQCVESIQTAGIAVCFAPVVALSGDLD